MRIIEKSISKKELRQLSVEAFGNLVKAVVDIEKEIMVIDAELHADEEALLLSKGSRQIDLWGINLYPDLNDDEFIEYDSMINLRPNQGNTTRGIDNPEIRNKIKKIISQLVIK